MLNRHVQTTVNAMQIQRLTEANILGYQLNRIENGDASSPRYEVLGPENAVVLASFRDRPSAEQFIVTRELSSIRILPRNPAY